MQYTSGRKGIYITVITLVGVIALFVGLYIFQASKVNLAQKKMEGFQGTLLKTPRRLSTFDLKYTNNKVFNNASLEGHWTLMFFGYTNCPMLCPVTMGELDGIYKKLQSAGEINLPQVILVSIDPKRDTAIKLEKYTKAFNPSFVGVLGDIKQVTEMAKEMGLSFTTMPNKNDPSNYMIQHSGTIVLLNPHGDIQGFFTTPHNVSQIAKDYELLVT